MQPWLERATQKWGKDERPPEQILQHHGAAPGNPNEFISGAREPIYHFNGIIRLQDVLEIIINQTDPAPESGWSIHSNEQRDISPWDGIRLSISRRRSTVWKIKWLRILLANRWQPKSGETGNKGNKKAAHVLVPTWKGWEGDTGSWFPGTPWVKRMLFLLFCATATLIFWPCTDTLLSAAHSAGEQGDAAGSQASWATNGSKRTGKEVTENNPKSKQDPGRKNRVKQWICLERGSGTWR